MTDERLHLLTRHLEGHRVGVALADGSRLDDCQLVSAGRPGSPSLWQGSTPNGADTFVTMLEVTDVWEFRPSLAEVARGTGHRPSGVRECPAPMGDAAPDRAAEFFARLDVADAPRRLVALGETLDVATLVAAYRSGCFPWPATGPYEARLERDADRLVRHERGPAGPGDRPDPAAHAVDVTPPPPRPAARRGGGQPVAAQAAAPLRLGDDRGPRLRRRHRRLRRP